MTKEFKKSKVNDKYRGIIPFEFDDSMTEDNKVKVPDTIHLIPIGEWAHDAYGPIIIKNSDIREFSQNFNAGIRKGVYITAGHEGFEELPAVGWIQKVEVRDDGLWGTVEWNEYGLESLQDKQWKFFSPELCRDYEDPQTHSLYRNVLTGGALTKSPYFKELQAIVFSDKNISNKYNENNMSKTLEEVLALDVSALTDEDKAVLKENAETLTDEQKVTYADVLKVEAPAETEEEKTAREDKEKADANIAAGLNPDGTAKEPDGGSETINASEKGFVKINASELAILKDMADKGAQAFAELDKRNLNEAVSGLMFSESNKKGAFLPKSESAVKTFMQGLNKEQRLAFSALIKEIPENAKFNEIGDLGNADVSTMATVDAKVEAMMKAKPTMKYSEALKEVFSANPELEKSYNENLTPVAGK